MPDGNSAHPRVRLVSVVGPQTIQSKCVDGVVLDTVLSPDVPDFESLRDVRVLLFSEALEMHESNGFSGVRCSGPPRRRDVEDYGVALAYAARCKALGVGLVGSRKGVSSINIPPRLRVDLNLHAEKGICAVIREALLEKGIIPIDRLSLRHIYSVQSAAGCNLLADFSSPVQYIAVRSTSIAHRSLHS